MKNVILNTVWHEEHFFQRRDVCYSIRSAFKLLTRPLTFIKN